MARKKILANNEIGEFSSMTLMIPKKLHDDALAIAMSQDKDLGNLLMIDVLSLLKQFVQKNIVIESVENEDSHLFQIDLFSNDIESNSKMTILPSSKDVGASRLLVDDEDDKKVTYGQFWVAYEKKLAPFMSDQEKGKMKDWMGGLVKKYGPANVMSVMMKLDNLAMMPANPVAWIAKALTNMSKEDAFKRNHGGQKAGDRNNSSGGMVNI